MNTQNSERLYERACKFMPGGVNSPVRACRSVGMSPLFIDHASGSRIYDEDGNEFIDYICSWGPNILGHAVPEVTQAVKAACDRGLTFGACHKGEIELAELIQKHFPSMEMLRLVNSGTEAVMSAIRAARGFTGRDQDNQIRGLLPRAFRRIAGEGRLRAYDSRDSLRSRRPCRVYREYSAGEVQ